MHGSGLEKIMCCLPESVSDGGCDNVGFKQRVLFSGCGCKSIWVLSRASCDGSINAFSTKILGAL